MAGKLYKTEVCLTKPFTSHLTVQHTEVAIKSLELQLIRVETCGCTESYSKDAPMCRTFKLLMEMFTRKLQMPIFMILPMLFTCSTLVTKNFKFACILLSMGRSLIS